MQKTMKSIAAGATPEALEPFLAQNMAPATPQNVVQLLSGWVGGCARRFAGAHPEHHARAKDAAVVQGQPRQALDAALLERAQR